jgi:sugar phosphate isomerase/epimerase
VNLVAAGGENVKDDVRKMGYQFSIAHLTALGLPTPELVYVAARAGYDYVSPRLIYMGLPGEPNYALAENPRMLKQTKAALASTGLRVHDIELARIVDRVDPKSYLPAIEIGAELGARGVVSSIWASDRSFYIDKFAELCDLARPFGMTVDLEYVPIAAVRNLAEAVDVLNTIKRPNAGLMIDMHHFHRARDNPADLEPLPREWFHFAHLCDAPAEIPTDRDEMIRILREARLDPGTGGIDIAAILAHMPTPLVLSIEQPNLERVREMGYAEHACRCLEAAKRYVAAHRRANAVSPPVGALG